MSTVTSCKVLSIMSCHVLLSSNGQLCVCVCAFVSGEFDLLTETLDSLFLEKRINILMMFDLN